MGHEWVVDLNNMFQCTDIIWVPDNLRRLLDQCLIAWHQIDEKEGRGQAGRKMIYRLLKSAMKSGLPRSKFSY